MPDIGSGAQADGERSRRSPSGGKLDRLLAARDPRIGRGTQLAGLTTRELGRVPDTPGGWSRFLLAHLRWILVITVLVVAAAAAYAHSQTPQYKSQATVDVYFTSPDPAALQGPNMVTEKEIVASQAVLGIAARSLAVPSDQLRQGLTLSVPAGSSIMLVGYSDPVPWVARERAQVIAESYVTYRSPKPTPGRSHTTTTTPAASVSTLHATLITPAALPGSPSSPNYLIDIFAALFGGLALGIGTAALRDHLDDRLRGPFDPQARTGAPVLALVPGYRALGRRPAGAPVIVWSPFSVVAEAYRGLRTRVVDAAGQRGARTLLVTSPAWENKSMVAANLAAALAQSGRRTVLVCADLRWGNAHELLGVPNDEGLTTLLDRRIDLASVLRAPGIHDLRVLPPGPLPRDPAEVLQRPALRTVLGELRSRADFVIIDAPPVLATPDTGPLAHLAEMVLMVSDARRSTRSHLQAAMHEAGGLAGKLIGCVLYNVGHRRWLQVRPVPRVIEPPDQVGWPRRDRPRNHPDGRDAPARGPAGQTAHTRGPDGHPTHSRAADGHAAGARGPAGNVTVPADPSQNGALLIPRKMEDTQ